MLAIPASGFLRSVKVHQCDEMVVADWIEGSVLFKQVTVSKTDLVDDLLDQEYYVEQDFANKFADTIWSILRRRAKWLGGAAPYTVGARDVNPSRVWRDAVGHSFCLMLTFLQRYPVAAYPNLHTGSTFVVQGNLFELLAQECIALQGWEVFRTGWASGSHVNSFQNVVQTVAEGLNESWVSRKAVEFFSHAGAKEEGLDLVCHSPFPDQRPGRPVFLLQCASGADWDQKLHTPRLSVWNQVINFTNPPSRGFCCPLALDGDELKKSCIKCEGVFFDRYRLLHGGGGLTANLPSQLQTQLSQWLAPRVAALPSL